MNKDYFFLRYSVFVILVHLVCSLVISEMLGLDAASAAKSAGNALFGSKDWEGARMRRARGLEAIKGEGDGASDASPELVALSVALRINRAACSLNLGKESKSTKKRKEHLEACIADCTHALSQIGSGAPELEASACKALYRRAHARELLGRFAAQDRAQLKRAFNDYSAILQRAKGSESATSAAASARKGVARLAAHLQKEADKTSDHPFKQLLERLHANDSDVDAESCLRQLITVVHDEGASVSTMFSDREAEILALAASKDPLAINVLGSAARASARCIPPIRRACERVLASPTPGPLGWYLAQGGCDARADSSRSSSCSLLSTSR